MKEMDRNRWLRWMGVWVRVKGEEVSMKMGKYQDGKGRSKDMRERGSLRSI